MPFWPRLGAVTASFGVVEQSGAHGAPHEVVSQADVALYQSKSGGRNRVTVFSAVEVEAA